MLNVIEGFADDLYHDCQIDECTGSADGIWEHKYIYNDYAEWVVTQRSEGLDESSEFNQLRFSVGGLFLGNAKLRGSFSCAALALQQQAHQPQGHKGD